MTSSRPSEQPQSGTQARTRLSRDQQWDVARMTGACIVTLVGLVSAIWMLPTRPALEAGDERREVPSAEVQPRVNIQTAEVQVPVSTPDLVALQDALPTLPASTRPATPARTRVASAARSRSSSPQEPSSEALPRRVARFITGDGRHEVRPFPTVPERQ